MSAKKITNVTAAPATAKKKTSAKTKTEAATELDVVELVPDELDKVAGGKGHANHGMACSHWDDWEDHWDDWSDRGGYPTPPDSPRNRANRRGSVSHGAHATPHHAAHKTKR